MEIEEIKGPKHGNSAAAAARVVRETMQMQSEAVRSAARKALKEQEEGRSVDGSGVSSGGDDDENLRETELPERDRRHRRDPADEGEEEDEEDGSPDLIDSMLEGLFEAPPADDWEADDSEREEESVEVDSEVAAEEAQTASVTHREEPAEKSPVPVEPSPEPPPASLAAVAPRVESVPAPSPAPVTEPQAAEVPPAQPAPDPNTPPPVADSGAGPVESASPSERAPVEVATAPSQVAPDTPRPGPGLAPRRRYEPELVFLSLPEEVSTALDGLVMGVAGSRQVQMVRQALANFGARLLSQCRMFEIRVVVTDKPPSSVVASLAGDVQYDHVTFGYFSDDRLCYVHAERMDDGDEFGQGVVQAFASAIDHSMGEDNFASRQSPAVQASYRACRQDESGHAFVDGYAAESVQSYFAQGVDAWMTQPEGLLQEDPPDCELYMSRSLLYDLDRSLYSYLQYLLRDVKAYHQRF